MATAPDTTTTDDGFTLAPDWRDRLTTLATDFYEASVCRTSNQDFARKEAVRDQFGEVLGNGTGRIVFPLDPNAYTDGDYDDYVVKLAQYNRTDRWDGRVQNRVETTNWHTTHSPHFVPVAASDPDDHWVVMPRGHPTTIDDRLSNEFSDWLDTAKDAHAHTHVEPEDIDTANVVVLNDSYKLCDYGWHQP